MIKPYFNLIKTVWHNGRTWHRSIVGYYIAYIIAQGCLSLSPYAFGRTIDVLQNFTSDKLSDVIYWLAFGVGALITFWVFHGPARIQERYVALRIQQGYKINFYDQITRMPLKWHQDHHSGNIITRLNRASQALLKFAGDQFMYIETIIKLLVSLGFLLWISLPVGLLNVFTCVLAATTVHLYDRKLIPLYNSQNEIDNHVGAVIYDYISNMTTVLTLRLGELTRSNLFQRMLSVWPYYRREVLINEFKWFSVGLVLSAMQSLILVTYIIYTLHTTGTIMIGLVVMMFRYQTDLNEVFYMISSFYSELVRMDTDIKGLDPVWKEMEQLAHVPLGERTARNWHEFNIEHLNFNHVSKHTDKHGKTEYKYKQVFQDLNLSFKRGEKIALIGSSGGGKSTLLNLLAGSYSADKVKLTIDGFSFDSLEPLQAITTLIPQDAELFENTVEFNVSLDLQVERSEIDQAIKLAKFDEVLETLPLGLQTDIREKGLNFSGGQKQRLALARGLFAARYSSLILMDEPTSSIDLQTEKQILNGILEAFSDATMLVSLHRLHLLSKFDKIIMLKHGKVIAYGTAQELLTNPGPVRDLWQSYKD